MTRRTLAVVTAGLSQPSSTRLLADQLADATRDALRADGSTVDVVVIELRDLAHDIVNNLITGFPSPALAQAIDALVSAEGVIAVSPLFHASYSGLFKSFFDVLEPGALAGKPVLLGATGGSARHSLVLDHAMRPLFAYLQSLVVPTGVYAASEDWASGGTAGNALRDRIDRAATQLASLVVQQPPVQAPDPYADAPSFESLLAGG
jgi:FMN reductase